MPTVKATTEPVNRAVHEIQERIRTGQYVPGQRLIEPDLVKEFGVKRGSVREALRILAGDGVITLVAQKGAHVRKLDSVELVEVIQLINAVFVVACRLHLRGSLNRLNLDWCWINFRELTCDRAVFRRNGLRRSLATDSDHH